MATAIFGAAVGDDPAPPSDSVGPVPATYSLGAGLSTAGAPVPITLHQVPALGKGVGVEQELMPAFSVPGGAPAGGGQRTPPALTRHRPDGWQGNSTALHSSSAIGAA